MNRIIVAIDSFKGCLTSAEANKAAAEGIIAHKPDAEVITIPVSDGGEGWLEAFQAATGGHLVDVNVDDPLRRPILAQYLMHDDTAVIEIAKASGLTLLSPKERNPMMTTSYGTGQLIVDAVRRGSRHIIVGLGGSATSDCGIGMLQALINGFAPYGTWGDVHALEEVRFTIATDVRNPLCGEKGAAHVFAPQKGANPEMVIELDERAKQFAEKSALCFGYDCQEVPGAGAAGGLGYAFLQYLNADCRSGIDLLLDAVCFEELLKDTSLIITGEGSADKQTLMGKVPFGILEKAKPLHVPVVLIAGRISDKQLLFEAGFSKSECINPPDISTNEAMKPEIAKRNIAILMQKIVC